MVNRLLFLLTILLCTTSLAIGQGIGYKETDPSFQQKVAFKLANPNGLFDPTKTDGMSGLAGPAPDCPLANPICVVNFPANSSFNGVGATQELNRNATCLIGGETNSNWFIFTVQTSGFLAFTINTARDFDFALYNITNGGCASVRTTAPVRCNYSADFGTTGLVAPASATVPLSVSASGNPLMPALNVTAGQTYALLVDNYSANNSAGYSLSFSTAPGAASIVDNTPPVLAATNGLVVDCSNPYGRLTITANEFLDCSRISVGDFTITGPAAVTVTGVSGVNCGNNTNQIIITYTVAGNVGGNYTLRHVGDITDMCGNLMGALNEPFALPNRPTIAGLNTVCRGTAVTLTASAGPPGTTYQWNTGATTQAITQTVNGTLSFTVTTTEPGACPSTSAAHVVSVVDQPIVSVNPSNAVSCSGGTVNVTASATVNGLPCVNCTFNFSNGANGVGSSFTTALPVGSFTVTATDPALSGACATSAPASVNILNNTATTTCNNIYVSPAGGGNGLTKATPTTIQNALLLAQCNNATIKMQVGDYTINAPLDVPGFVTIEGGYNSTFTEKTSSMATAGAYPNRGTRIIRSNTAVDPGSPAATVGNTANPYVKAINVLPGSTDVRLQDLRIEVQNWPAGTRVTNYGIYLGSGVSNYNIVRCFVDAGTGAPGQNGTNGVSATQTRANSGGNGAAADGARTGGAGGTSAIGRAGGAGGTGGAAGNNAGSAGTTATGGATGGSGGSARTAGGCLGCCDCPGSSQCGTAMGGVGTAGANGTDGTNGVNGAASSFAGGLFLPGGNGTNGTAAVGDGFGGGGGGGGGGQRDPDFLATDNTGAGGGGGGAGGVRAGAGGTGGIAGGGAFAIFTVSTGGGANITDCFLAAAGGSAGTGGAAGLGQPGGLGGSGGGQCDGGGGGNGGAGGRGGNSGSGGTGPAGQSCLVCNLVGGVLTNTAFSNFTTLATAPRITAENTNCVGVDVDLTTAHATPTWNGLGTGATLAVPVTNAAITTQYSSIGRKTLTLPAGPTTINAQTFTFTGGNQAIPDNNCTGATATIAVAGYPAGATTTNTALSVNFSITHSYDGDLVIYLVSPGGTILGLVNRRGGSADNFTNTTMSDAGATAIASGAAPFTGSFRPETGTFSNCLTSTVTTFAGILPNGSAGTALNGNWSLRVFDRAAGDIGNITAFSITFPPLTVPGAGNDRYTDFVDISTTTAPNPPGINSTADTLCPAQVGRFFSARTSGITSYAWRIFNQAAPATTLHTDADDSTSFRFNTPGTYTVRLVVRNECCNNLDSSDFVVFVEGSTLPGFTANPGFTICPNTSTTISLSPAPPAGSTVVWSTGTIGNSTTITPSVTTIVTADIITPAGCSLPQIDTTVVVHPLATIDSIVGNPKPCTGDPVTLTVFSPDAGATFQWSGLINATGNTVTFTPTADGPVDVQVTTNGCPGEIRTVLVQRTTRPIPQGFVIGGVTTICAGDLVEIEATGGKTYEWRTSATGPIISTNDTLRVNPATTTTYFLTAYFDDCISLSQDQITITVDPSPTVFNVTGGGSYCAGGTGLPIGLDGSEVGVTYTLSRGATVVSTVTRLVAGAFDFPVQTVAGTYTVTATSPAASCGATMAGSATITINANPTVFNVTGGGAFCAGGAGVVVGLSGSEVGVDYQIFNGATAGTTVAGTGAAISFGNQTAAGTYTVVATNTTSLCTTDMSGSAVVTVNPTPTVFNVNGGGAFCSGGAGAAIGLSGSENGITYELFRGATSVASLPGTGSALSFGNQTTPGTYTVVATNGGTTCTANMNGSVVITVNANPTAFNVTGGGSFCAGGAGVAIGLSGSEVGVDYQIFNGATAGATVAGTGAAISFGNQTAAGTYTVVATNPTTTCTTNMTGSAVITVNPTPAVFTVTGGGSFCAGGTGVVIGLNGSENGISYQLFRGATALGTVAGTGSPISFGNQTTPGTYTVVATNTGTTCSENMTGSATITIDNNPTAFNVTGGGSFCTSGAGVVVGLSGSENGVNYQLFRGATALGTVPGTGAAISFGNQTVAGTYTVVATNTTTSCVTNMNGSAVITINPDPTVFTVTGGGAYCAGGTGVAVGLNGSENGVDYQLFRGATLVSTVAGTGAAISFGNQTTAGTYTVVAVNATSSCQSNMTGQAVITINAIPTAFNVTGGGAFCSGGTGVAIGLSGSETGVDYQLFRGATLVSTVSGTGAAISFGNQTTAGTYTVVGSSVPANCQTNMTGSATITVNQTPSTFNVTGGGSFCSGGTGVAVGLSGSEVGVDYQLFNGATLVTTLPGTGAAISFGNQTAAGTYTVVAVNPTSSCQANMNSSAVVVVNPTPTAFNVTGGGAFCSGGTGVAIGLSGSETGVDYQLFRGATLVSTVSGTGAAISFGNQTTAGTYTVVGSSVPANCQTNMTGSATITVNQTPSTFNVTGGGSFCSGGTGVAVGLSGSEAGVDYQLFNGATLVTTLPGTGAVISFGNQTAAGTYTVVAVNPTSSCQANMNSSAVVVVNPTPTAFNVTGGGAFCSGGAGIVVGLNGSEAGVDYQLFRGATQLSTVAGTGAAISFGSQTVAGTYTVVAVNATSSCQANMNGSAVIVVNATPNVFNVTGGGAYCAGGAGVVVGLNGSEVGVDYQLFRGATQVSTVAGTGAAISFGNQTVAGTYTVVAVNPTTTCQENMTGSAVITIDPLPNVGIQAVGSTICEGQAAIVTIAAPEAGVSYQLFRNGLAVLGAQTGPAAITFTFPAGTFSPGTYNIRVLATQVATGCADSLTATATIIVNAAPQITLTIEADSICEGQNGVVRVLNAQAGISYQAQIGGVNVGAAANGPSASLNLTIPAANLSQGNNTISVIATDVNTTCTATLTQTVNLFVKDAPTLTLVVAGSTVCANQDATVTISNPEAGVTYTLSNGGTPIATSSSIVGNTLTLTIAAGSLAPGSYTLTVTGVNNSTSCSGPMAQTATVVINAIPSVSLTLTDITICEGEPASVILQAAQNGVSYQMFDASGTTPIGNPQVGAGGNLSFSVPANQLVPGRNAFIVRANGGICSSVLTDTAFVTLNPRPVVPALLIQGNTTTCIGSGEVIRLSIAPQTGVTYQWTRNGVVIPGQNNFDITIDESFGSGVYNLIVTNNSACPDTATAGVRVVFNPLPAAPTVTATNIVCEGNAAVITINNPVDQYTLFGSPTGGVGTPINGGRIVLSNLASDTIVYIEASNANCTLSPRLAVPITVAAIPTANFTSSPTVDTILYFPNTQVSFTNRSQNATSYLWQFGDGQTSTEVNPVHSYADTGTYTVRLIAFNDLGCADTIEVGKHRVVNKILVYIPNAFSPNSDGTNDDFIFTMIGLESFQFIIYDRWGIVVYENQNSPTEFWDGTKNGNPVPEGVYVYVLQGVRAYDKKTYETSGTITVIR